jgi:predicted O-methyltransferase YrrM
VEKELLDFLKDLKQYGIENDIPNVSERRGRLLNMLVKISKAKNVLEIGCANGYSTIWLADAVHQNGGKVVTIDFSKPSLQSAKDNMTKAGLLEVVDFYFGDALEIIPTITTPKKFDFIFVDGEKRSYWDFWGAIQNRLSTNAIVVFDNIFLFPDKTESFMKKIKGVVGFTQVVLPINGDDGVLILCKN